MKKLTVKQQANRIQKILNLATKTEIENGKNWYLDAYNFALEVSTDYSLTVSQVSQLISLLSPQKKWEQNKSDVVNFLNNDTGSIFSTKKTLSECVAVVDQDFTIPQNRMKTFAFAKCIEEAKDNTTDPVVIDRHAIKISYGQMNAKPIIITDLRYKESELAYRMVARENKLRAHEVQAITWVAYKRIVNR